MININLQLVRWGDELYFFLLKGKLWEMTLSFNLIDQIRSNVWVSHSSFLAADRDGHLSRVLSRSLPVFYQICQQPFGFKMSDFHCERAFAWENDWKDFHSVAQRRWKDIIFYGWCSTESTKDESLCCKRKSRHLQLKVNNSNSICHGLHGCKIKTFFIKGAQ